MFFGEKLEKFSIAIEKIQDWFDTSPATLYLSLDEVLREKIKVILSKYALYEDVNARDLAFNGFGLLEVEFVGKETELDNIKLVIGKRVFDYLRLYYLGFTRVKVDTQKIGENMYIVQVYYSFSKKTLRNFDMYFDEISIYKKKEVLEREVNKDEELEQELKEWKIE